MSRPESESVMHAPVVSTVVPAMNRSDGAWVDSRSRVERLIFVLSIAALTLVAGYVRFSALNPASLWWDDLAWAVLARADSVREMLLAPTHAPPGFLLLLRLLASVFSDREWPMQLPAYFAGLAAIPVMALAVRRLTDSRALAILAAALTALNPLLAHYTVYVKQYSIDFLASAVLLFAAAPALRAADARLRDVWRMMVLGAVIALFSVGSVFLSCPIVAVLFIRAWWRQRSSRMIIVSGLAFVAILIATFLVFRTRTSSLSPAAIENAIFRRSYRLDRIWAFILDNERTVELSFPSWVKTDPWNPSTVWWSLLFVALGLVGLFARKGSRARGWVIVGFVAAFAVAGYTNLYPLTTDRRIIFVFPVFLYVGVTGFHLLTEWLPRRETIRMAIAIGVVVFALYAPIRVNYWAVDDSELITPISTMGNGDGLILSRAAAFLAAYYGPWPIEIGNSRQPDDSVTILRGMTIVALANSYVDEFLGRSHPNRIWYVAYRTAGDEDDGVLDAMMSRGYSLEPIERSTKGTLYLGTLH